jgi:hypothetical protein
MLVEIDAVAVNIASSPISRAASSAGSPEQSR